MNVAALLEELQGRGIRIWADGDRLRCNAPTAELTTELRDQLAQRKQDILEFLRSAAELGSRQRAIVPLERIEELAGYFASQVRAFRRGAPCVIAGFCAGGAVAFELAQQLRRGG